MICELECVDYVILMEDSNPVNIIKNIKPNISVKGEDWKNKNVPEQKILEVMVEKSNLFLYTKGNQQQI